jgi:hypothetical protein
MMVIVEMNVIVAPSAPRKPMRLFQKPATNKTQISHSEIPCQRQLKTDPPCDDRQSKSDPPLGTVGIKLMPFS